MNLRLRDLTASDCELLFQWANDPKVRDNSINSNPISLKSHLEWFQNKLISEDSKIFILESDKLPVGQIRFDKVDNNWLINYSIDEKYRGKGLGKKLIEMGIEKFGPLELIAYVKPDNFPSINVFQSLGFKLEGIEYNNGIELIKFNKKFK